MINHRLNTNRIIKFFTVVFCYCLSSLPVIADIESPCLSESSYSTKFAITVSEEVKTPVFVLLQKENGQIGWVNVKNKGENIFLKERCEIISCNNSSGVCGASLPVIQDISVKTNGRVIQFYWDQMTSFIKNSPQCEVRVSALEGDYTASFCYSHSAISFTGDNIKGEGIGQLVSPVCVSKSFQLKDKEVILEVFDTSSVP